MTFVIDPNSSIDKNGQTWWWITSKSTGEIGWIIENDGQVVEWKFLGQNLDPKKAIYDKKIQRLCPDLINMMIIYLTHQE